MTVIPVVPVLSEATWCETSPTTPAHWNSTTCPATWPATWPARRGQLRGATKTAATSTADSTARPAEAVKQATCLTAALKASRITEAAARLADQARDAG
jgi:hypothetical protein